MRKKFYYLGEYWRLIYYRNDEAQLYRSLDRRKWLGVFKEGDETLIHLVKDDDDTDIITSDKGEWLYVLKGTEKLTFLSKDGLSLSSNEENHLERIVSAISKIQMEIIEIRNSENQRLRNHFFKNIGSFVSNLWNYLFKEPHILYVAKRGTL